jgi:hypothetical protein
LLREIRKKGITEKMQLTDTDLQYIIDVGSILARRKSMLKKKLLAGLFCLAVLLVWVGGIQASGLVTFRVEVISGMTISSPSELVFSSVVPGIPAEKDLEIIVWSNVEWELKGKAVDDGLGGLEGLIEAQDSHGTWYDLAADEWILRRAESPTGEDGLTLDIPFRFTASYSDAPANYQFEIELTVVPAI